MVSLIEELKIGNHNLHIEEHNIFSNVGVIDNTRYDSLYFTVSEDVVMHGFAGYFDCILYGDINISKLNTMLTMM